MQSHFGSYREHPAVAALGSDFNMPRFVGNAADFKLDASGSLQQIAFEGSLWADRNGDSFRENLKEIEDFARVSNFKSFFSQHSDYYSKLTETADAINDVGQMATWLEANFTERLNAALVFVSMLLSGHHWTSGKHQSTLRIWVDSQMPGSETELDDVNRTNHARATFAELDHPYVNPVSDLLLSEIEVALSNSVIWATESAQSNYDTLVAILNEYMTCGVYLLFAQQALDDETASAKRKTEVDEQMVERRGFIKIDEFGSELLRLASVETFSGKAESLFDPMVDWCAAENR